jgi:hypothetical protein
MLSSSAGGQPLDAEVTELVDKAPPTTHGGGNEATPPNATLMAFCFIIMTARMAAFPVRSSMLAKA